MRTSSLTQKTLEHKTITYTLVVPTNITYITGILLVKESEKLLTKYI